MPRPTPAPNNRTERPDQRPLSRAAFRRRLDLLRTVARGSAVWAAWGTHEAARLALADSAAQVPSVRALATACGIDRNTAARHRATLVRAGLWTLGDRQRTPTRVLDLDSAESADSAGGGYLWSSAAGSLRALAELRAVDPRRALAVWGLWCAWRLHLAGWGDRSWRASRGWMHRWAGVDHETLAGWVALLSSLGLVTIAGDRWEVPGSPAVPSAAKSAPPSAAKSAPSLSLSLSKSVDPPPLAQGTAAVAASQRTVRGDSALPTRPLPPLSIAAAAAMEALQAKLGTTDGWAAAASPRLRKALGRATAEGADPRRLAREILAVGGLRDARDVGTVLASRVPKALDALAENAKAEAVRKAASERQARETAARVWDGENRVTLAALTPDTHATLMAVVAERADDDPRLAAFDFPELELPLDSHRARRAVAVALLARAVEARPDLPVAEAVEAWAAARGELVAA